MRRKHGPKPKFYNKLKLFSSRNFQYIPDIKKFFAHSYSLNVEFLNAEHYKDLVLLCMPRDLIYHYSFYNAQTNYSNILNNGINLMSTRDGDK